MCSVLQIIAPLQACARIGAVHTIVFAGFSATALEARIQNAGSKVVITADQGFFFQISILISCFMR